MAFFYDPANEADLERVMTILKENGIEFFLKAEPEPALGPGQIHVAEEDFVKASKLVELVGTRH